MLRRLGAEEVRQTGSHLMVRVGTCQAVIPVHRGDMKPGTLRSIERQLAPCLGEGWLTKR